MHFFQLLLPDFSLILCGYVLCRWTALDRKVWEPVERLVYYFLFPLMLFYAVVKTPLELQSTSHLVVSGWLLGGAAILFVYALPYWPWLGRYVDRRLHAGSAQIGFRFNSMIALPLAEQLAGPQGLLWVAILIGMCVPLLNVAAVWPMARHSNQGMGRELLRNPLILATTSGLVLNLLGLGVPQWLQPSISRIGLVSLPLGLMAAGAGMQLGLLRQGKMLAFWLLLSKHAYMPLIAWAIAYALGLAHDQALILLMFSALPTASSSYVLAARMGYNGAYVASLVTLSTLLGMLSLPFALGVLGAALP
jgi:predicted permease